MDLVIAGFLEDHGLNDRLPALKDVTGVDAVVDDSPDELGDVILLVLELLGFLRMLFICTSRDDGPKEKWRWPLAML